MGHRATSPAWPACSPQSRGRAPRANPAPGSWDHNVTAVRPGDTGHLPGLCRVSPAIPCLTRPGGPGPSAWSLCDYAAAVAGTRASGGVLRGVDGVRVGVVPAPMRAAGLAVCGECWMWAVTRNGVLPLGVVAARLVVWPGSLRRGGPRAGRRRLPLVRPTPCPTSRRFWETRTSALAARHTGNAGAGRWGDIAWPRPGVQSEASCTCPAAPGPLTDLNRALQMP
jgi:hypothetical protein